jgi:hypothetical protein
LTAPLNLAGVTNGQVRVTEIVKMRSSQVRSGKERKVVQFGKEASQTRNYCVAKSATLRAVA